MDRRSAMVTRSTYDDATMPLGGQSALLESFSAIAEALTSSGDLATVLQCIAEEALRLLHATSARVRMPDASGTQLLLAALADDAEATIRLPPPDAISHLQTDSIAGKAFRTNQIYVARGARRATTRRPGSAIRLALHRSPHDAEPGARRSDRLARR